MDPERWRRAEALFLAAAEKPARERAGFLAAACAGDASLRGDVERLLRGDAGADDLLERFGVLPGIPARRPDPMLGREVGAYRLVARIAAGGMGVVYRGVRADGLFDQEVAVKLVRAESASDEAIERFEFERRTLAALNHPNVARLYDGGATAEGTPYIVMEFVHGRPIDCWCAEQRLSVAERLRLFAVVCRAVHFAHQNLIVHGDLKPGNILVDANGVPKLLDFGIARLLEAEEGAQVADVTRTLARLLTPEYASPEQLRGAPLTTAADVYSLGVLLYVLLTGEKPLRSDGLSPGQWERVVAEKEPTQPSTAVLERRSGTPAPPAASADVEEFAASCGTTPARLRRVLRGDLDRIALMALRKEPQRRYASALQLAEDVERHLSGHPVQARPDTPAYRMRTFVRRNRAAVGAALLVLLSLVLGLLLAIRAERRAAREAAHARIEADSFRLIADMALETFLPTYDLPPAEARESAREALHRRADQVRRQYPDAYHLRANLLDALGRVCLELDDRAGADALVREALAIREREFGARSLEVALSRQNLARLQLAAGEPARAAAELERALELHRTLSGVHTDVAMAANDLGAVLCELGRLDEAERLHEEALELRRERDGARALPVAESLLGLAAVQVARGDDAAAALLLEEALDIRRAILGSEHAETLKCAASLEGARMRRDAPPRTTP